MRTEFINWLLPVQVVARELKKYNDRGTPYFNNPAPSMWPSMAVKNLSKRNYKDLTKLIVKFKRRERWAMLKADLGPEYLERLHKDATSRIDVNAQFGLLNCVKEVSDRRSVTSFNS